MSPLALCKDCPTELSCVDEGCQKKGVVIPSAEREQEGYPGIAHDMETLRAELADCERALAEAKRIQGDQFMRAERAEAVASASAPSIRAELSSIVGYMIEHGAGKADPVMAEVAERIARVASRLETA